MYFCGVEEVLVICFYIIAFASNFLTKWYLLAFYQPLRSILF